MNRRRWHRVINVAVVLAVMATLILLPALLEASPDTVTLRPMGAGDEANLTPYPDTGEANWEDIDEATSDDDTTYVVTTANVYTTDLYALEDTTTLGKGKINSVTVYINVRVLNTPIQPSAHTRIKTNAVAYDGTPVTLTTTYATYSTAYTTNPQTTSEWTWLEVNNLQAGVGLRQAQTTGAEANRESRGTQVWVVVDYTPATLESYDDDIQSNVWGTVADPYDAAYNVAYIYGPNFTASHGYNVGYYDNAGTKIQSEGVTSAADNTLSSQYLLTTNPSAEAGIWHVVVYDNDIAPPPPAYVASDPDSVVEDSFEVAVSAIPEFSTVMAAIAVAVLCFGIYYWMRKKYRREVVSSQ